MALPSVLATELRVKSMCVGSGHSLVYQGSPSTRTTGNVQNTDLSGSLSPGVITMSEALLVTLNGQAE